MPRSSLRGCLFTCCPWCPAGGEYAAGARFAAKPSNEPSMITKLTNSTSPAAGVGVRTRLPAAVVRFGREMAAVRFWLGAGVGEGEIEFFMHLRVPETPNEVTKNLREVETTVRLPAVAVGQPDGLAAG